MSCPSVVRDRNPTRTVCIAWVWNMLWLCWRRPLNWDPTRERMCSAWWHQRIFLWENGKYMYFNILENRKLGDDTEEETQRSSKNEGKFATLRITDISYLLLFSSSMRMDLGEVSEKKKEEKKGIHLLFGVAFVFSVIVHNLSDGEWKVNGRGVISTHRTLVISFQTFQNTYFWRVWEAKEIDTRKQENVPQNEWPQKVSVASLKIS